ERVELGPSAVLPTLTGVYLRSGVPAGKSRSWKRDARLLDYRGWILSESEYDRFGYAVHTAVHLPGLLDSDQYLLLGDPTAPAAQINCRTGTVKKANAKLVLDAAAVRAARRAGVPLAVVTVRVAAARVCAGEELWLDYGEAYWQQVGHYCPHCLEYGGDDEDDRMLLCDAPGCKRAWHQLCLQPCRVDVPDGPFQCDVHRSQPVSSHPGVNQA
ncbi:MAG: PHD finger domain-containing protein, partial [Nevskia sp.]|nr:PHD finger domain-containing protein [Nevskia sp.]